MPAKTYIFEDATIDKLLLYLAEIYDDEQNYLNWLSVPNNVQLLKPDTFSDLINNNPEEDLFAELPTGVEIDTSKNNFIATIIDFTKIDLENQQMRKKFEQFVSIKQELNQFIYSNNLKFTINAEFKKTLKMLNVEVVSLKKMNPATALLIALAYRNKKQILISQQDIEQVVNSSFSYIEIIDKLDFLSNCPSVKEGLNSLLPDNNPALFMLGFDLEKPKYENWLKLVTKDEYQLSLSLIFTKLLKLEDSKEVSLWKKRVINLDKAFKSGDKMTGENMWKLFLWQFKNKYLIL